jgi:agmatine/peptidylarginine deiminase
MDSIVFPSEWYPQSGVQLTWPHAETDWQPILEEVEKCFIQIAREIALREILLIVTPNIEHVKDVLHQNNIQLDNIRFFSCETNDTWARDHGGITVLKNNRPAIFDFKFNGWGLKFAANFDNLITFKLCKSNYFQADYDNRLNFVLEGGGVESDGKGTLLTTTECLLSLNRNGQWNQQQIEDYLKETFGLKRILWLNNGFLEGDDTDSHIDTLARFCPHDTIVYVKCDDKNDVHFSALKKMEEELIAFRTLDNKSYRLLPLPMADAVYCDGERLPATYANFLILNDAVLYPIYNQPQNDQKAAEILQKAFLGYEIVGVDCSALIKQHGSLHCVTMQYPQGVLI